MIPLVFALSIGCSLISPRTAPCAIGRPTACEKGQPAKQVAKDADPERPACRHALAVTAQTEVFLDGRACSYEEVPDGAVVTGAEVASDRLTVLKIFFRSPRAPGSGDPEEKKGRR